MQNCIVTIHEKVDTFGHEGFPVEPHESQQQKGLVVMLVGNGNNQKSAHELLVYQGGKMHYPIRFNWHPLEAAGIGTYCMIMVYICKAWVSNVWIRSVGSSVPFSVFSLILCLRRFLCGEKKQFYIVKNGTFVKMGIFQTLNQPGI